MCEGLKGAGLGGKVRGEGCMSGDEPMSGKLEKGP